MQLSPDQLQLLCNKAIKAAKDAGSIIRSFSKQQVKVNWKAGGQSLASQVVTEVDLKSQDAILEVLQPTLKEFDLALLSEEAEDNKSRFEKDYFWCIDPLDGTLPFTEQTNGYAVAIALVSKSGIPQIGVIYDPDSNNLYSAIKEIGVKKNGASWVPFHLSESTFHIIINRSFLSHPKYNTTIEVIKSMAKQMGLSKTKIVSHGGAIMNACWVLENAPAVYFKFPQLKNGGGSLWDFAATACIFNEVGASATDSFGENLDLNRAESTFMNHKGILYASNQNIADCFIAKKLG